MSNKLSIIFVVGAWHTEFHVRPIAPYLETNAYRIVPVKLPTSTKTDPPPVIQDNIEHIRKIIEAEIDAGYRVCLLGHSLSGQSCAAAASEYLSTASEDQKSKFVHIIFTACFLNALRATEKQNFYTIDWETMWTTVNIPYEAFYNDMSRGEAQPFIDALDSNLAQMPPDPMPDLWKKEIKGKTYFLCRKDQAIPPAAQRPEAEENGMELVELDMDHCPFVSRPKEFAEEVHKVLQQYQ